MKLFQEFSNSPSGRAILLSIKPVYSDLILAGKKKIELRRSWAADDVGVIALYASAPVQRIVALVDVKDVITATPTKLWGHCKRLGGGLSKAELDDYLDGKDEGYGIFLGRVHKLSKPVDPEAVFNDFHAPQSFRYLSDAEIRKLAKTLVITAR
jgi:predicted transcriptional regulator